MIYNVYKIMLTSQSQHTTRTLITATKKNNIGLYAAYAKNSQSRSSYYNPTANPCGLSKTINRNQQKTTIHQVRLIPRIPKFCTSDDGVDAGTVGTCWRAKVHEEYGKHATPHPLKVTHSTRLQWGGYPPKNMLNRNLTSYTVIHI